MSILGLKRGTVKLSEHYDEWAKLFKKEKQLLFDKLGDNIIAIEHVGSTAVPSVPAKPLIDINVAVESIDDVAINKFIEPLKKIGYTYMHKYPDRHFFAKGSEEKRTHHLNLVKMNSDSGWKDHIMFRDHLRRNESSRNKYIKLKIKLAKQYPNDRPSYTKAKEEFIQEIIQRAKLETVSD